MWYSTIGDRKSVTVVMGRGNVVQYFWGQEMWYSTVGDRIYGTVLLGRGKVVQYC
jgi:hypothetical protein